MQLLNRSITNSIVDCMKKKGNYHSAYMNVIEILSGILTQYYTLDKNMSDETLNEVLTHLKNDIALYSDRLRLDHEDLKGITKAHHKQFKLYERG